MHSVERRVRLKPRLPDRLTEQNVLLLPVWPVRSYHVSDVPRSRKNAKQQRQPRQERQLVTLLETIAEKAQNISDVTEADIRELVGMIRTLSTAGEKLLGCPNAV